MQVVFVTHDGRFHCDDVLACVLFRILYPDGKICRTRNLDRVKLENRDAEMFFVDVGEKYDEANNLFDHHQQDSTIANVTFDDNSKIPLAASGLFFKKYGVECVRKVVDSFGSDEPTSPGYEPDYEALTRKIYFEFVNEIQANDNGIWNEYVLPMACPTFLNLPQIVSKFNDFLNDCIGLTQEGNFMKAVCLVDSLFRQSLRNIYDTELLYYDLVKRGFKAKEDDTVTLEDSRHSAVVNRYLKSNGLQRHFMIYTETDANNEQCFVAKRLAGSKRKLSRPSTMDDEEFKSKVICIHKNGFLAKARSEDTLDEIISTSRTPPAKIQIPPAKIQTVD